MVGDFFRKAKDFLASGVESDRDEEREYDENVRPASEDPYGDPADQQYYGERAGYEQYGDVRPASEDPYGDPADEEGYR